MDGSYYIARCVNSGVFFVRGREAHNDNETLQYFAWSRMIWSWEGAAALSQVARDGITGGKVCVAIEGRTVMDVCEVLPCTEAAAQNLLGQPEWVAR